MDFRFLGRSGLEVARLGLGGIPFGTSVDEAAAREFVDRYAAAGGNWIDTSNQYGGGSKDGSNQDSAGASERTVGRVLKGRRDRFILATKGYWCMHNAAGPNRVGLSRTYLAENIEGSLRRLQTDYIDLYQCHSWDRYTPIEETLRVLDDFVRAGKIRYVGVSNFDGWHVVKAQRVAEERGYLAVAANQIWYNLADRGAENSIIPACREEQVSVIAWGVLGEGFLTGEHYRGMNGPAPGSKMPLAVPGEMWSWENLAHEQNWQMIDVVANIARERGKTVPNIVSRWLLDGGACDAILVGAGTIEQLNENLKILEFELSTNEIEQLRTVSEPKKSYPRNFHDLFCRKESEFYGGLR
jgi:aryl-alcohol dehydrogenase-like predicted oxidoreductase